MHPSDGSAALFSALAVVGAIMGFVGPIIFGLLKALDAQKEKEKDRRLSVIEAEQKDERQHREALAERLRLQELSAMEVRGNLKLLEQNHAGVEKDISEIKAQQVPRMEWDRVMREVDRRLDEILESLRQSSRQTRPYGSSTSSSSTPAVTDRR